MKPKKGKVCEAQTMTEVQAQEACRKSRVSRSLRSRGSHSRSIARAQELKSFLIMALLSESIQAMRVDSLSVSKRKRSVWHKQCFKCQSCNMTLNMRNYKGFNKDPYCEAHIPKAKATTVAETPEYKRIAENTKLQSNVKYHAEFEKTKGKLTQVADDPETLRIKQNSKIISNVAYHGDLQKKAEMEQKRNINGEPPEITASDAENMNIRPPSTEFQPNNQMTVPSQKASRDFNILRSSNAVQNSPYSARQNSTVIYTSERGAVNSPAGRHIGSIADLDPVNNYYGSLTQNPAPAQEQLQPRRGRNGRVYRAMYDYEARDRDEVSFLDGDLIVDCTAVDAGWMTGLVQRTGQVGMLPANYVEPAL